MLKSDETLSSHLCYDFGHDLHGKHYYQPKIYVSKMLCTYECMFPGETLKKQSNPTLKEDHEELDEGIHI